MEQITNFETQNLDQNLNPITPQKNIFKILFFILLALVLVIISVLTTLLVTKNKSITPVQELTTIPSPTIIPTKTIVDETANWQTYTNSTYKYSIQYSNQWIFREFPNIHSGASFRLSSDVGKEIYQDDNWIEFISIDLSGRVVSLLNTSFDEYVKIAASLEFEGGYDSISKIEKITTQYGVIGYKVVWNGHDRQGNKIITQPITYFDTKNQNGDTIQIRLNDENYLDDYNKMILSFKFN